MIATSYGQSAWSLASQLGIADVDAAEMLEFHHRAFPKYWEWSNNISDIAQLGGKLSTLYGWDLHVGINTHEAWRLASQDRTVRNFPIQATASEMTRVACTLAVERGLKVAAVVHDALLVEADDDEAEIERVKSEAMRAMREASELVLFGFAVKVDVQEIRRVGRRHPKRCIGKGAATWLEVMKVLGLK